ncbi:MAG TPA: hypothetical protein VKA34_02530 [Balneolales bacterium]|nr:hypothetical protein [Balneolales bacterium]
MIDYVVALQQQLQLQQQQDPEAATEAASKVELPTIFFTFIVM